MFTRRRRSRRRGVNGFIDRLADGVVTAGTTAASSYGNGKRKVLLIGVSIGVAVSTQVARYAPKMTKKLGKLFKGKERRVGRGTAVPEQEQGSIQDNVVKEEKRRGTGESIQEVEKPVKKRKVSRLKMFANTVQKKEEDAIAIEGNALRLLGQVLGACKRHNSENGSLKVTYELEFNREGELILKLDGKILRVNENGIYSMVGNPYYIYQKMDKSDGLNRLVSDFGLRNMNFVVSLLMVYEMDLFDEDEIDELFGKLKDDLKQKKDIEKTFSFDED